MNNNADFNESIAVIDEISGIAKLMRSAIGAGEERKPGISVIIPCYRSANTILETLESLERQFLDKRLFEAIVVFNGESDGSDKLVADWSASHNTNVRHVWSATKGASRARNIGIKIASHEYLTFVDSDDWIQPHYLSDAFRACTPGSVVVNPILDTDGETLIGSSALTQRIRDLGGQKTPVAAVPWALGFNACKTVHHTLLSHTYKETLGSGEDLVYFANLLKHENLTLTVLHETSDNSYIRRLTDRSISRGNTGFEFNVVQRVKCIDALNHVEVAPSNEKALSSLKEAQAGFIARYITAHPDSEGQLVEVLDGVGANEFPWPVVNRGKANDLVIAYCFPPFNDTSAVVCSKVVADRAKKVDVISANLKGIREEDPSLELIHAQWIDEQHVLNTPPAFSNWESIRAFAEEALTTARNIQKRKGRSYETLYTRAMWAGSHAAGALVKLQQPSISWTAEFSDPLRFGVDGEPREGAFESDAVSLALAAAIESHSPELLPVNSLFDLIEFSTVLLADELIFTNEIQLDYMSFEYPDWLKQLVRSKSLVRPHPSPPHRAYTAKPCSYQFDDSRINLAYFGSFYSNRGLNDVLVACMNLDVEAREKIRLNLFTNSKAAVEQEAASLGLDDIVRVSSYLPYLEFLNACTKVDVLIVNDVKRSSTQSINPFLPSKFSDYRRSEAKIWGIIDPGSPLSQQPLDFVSRVGDSPSALKILTHLADTKHDEKESSVS